MIVTLDGAAVVRTGVTRLGPLDLTLDVSGTVAVMGPNGAGKSLLLRVLHGLTAPEKGRVTWEGASPASTRGMRGFVFQTPPMLRRSVAANLAFPLRARGVAADPRRIADLLALARLSEVSAQPAATLSGGERLRLALAQALAHQPPVLILDEPGASLDPTELVRLEDLIAEVRRDGTAVLMATHNLGQARRLADRVLYLERGLVVADMTADTFFAPDAPEKVRQFLEGVL